MKVNWYTKVVLIVIAAALSLIAMNPWLRSVAPPQAVEPRFAEAQNAEEISKAWGRVVGFTQNGAWHVVLFEASDGTLRAFETSRAFIVRR